LENPGLSQKEIITKTGLSPRSVKYSLGKLASLNLIYARNSFRDRRRKIYFLRKKKTIGIIGGLSPEITSEFYLKIVEKSRRCGNHYPHIVIDSVSIDFSLEGEIIIGAKNEQKLLPLLIESVRNLQDTDLILIPCNTAHIFIEELRKKSKVPIISIVEETTKTLKFNGYKKVGLLATTSTISSRIYIDKEIKFIYPSLRDQKELSEIIVKLIRQKMTELDKAKLQRISEKLRQKCDIVLLACTDLRRVLKGDYLDTFDILLKSVYEKIMIKK